MRLLIAEDSTLLRDGLVRLAESAGHTVAALATDGPQLHRAIHELHPPPDAALLDIRMPPTHTDEGSRHALTLRALHPDVGILLLSQHIEANHALRLLRDHPHGFGYLLKDRVADVDDLLDALERVAHGGYVVDPEVITQLLRRTHNRDALTRLTPREADVLALLAEGASNTAISTRLRLSGKTIENHISSIFTKLDLTNDPDEHRRVRAVLLYLGQHTNAS